MNYIIRNVRSEDIPQILEIEENTFSLPFSEEALRTQLNPDNHIFICAECSDGEIAGYVGMMFVLDEGYINNVAVKPEYRKQGIGYAIISRLQEECENKNLAFATLEVRSSNVPAIALYNKCKFQVVGTRKNYYIRPKEDALIMTYYLNRGNNT